MTVNIHKLKTHASRKPKQRQLGTERRKMWMAPDFDELPPEFLRAFYGGRLPKVEHPPSPPKRAKRLP
jgi:hypothetical protein